MSIFSKINCCFQKSQKIFNLFTTISFVSNKLLDIKINIIKIINIIYLLIFSKLHRMLAICLISPVPQKKKP